LSQLKSLKGQKQLAELEELEQFAAHFKRQRIKHGIEEVIDLINTYLQVLLKEMWELLLVDVMEPIFHKQPFLVSKHSISRLRICVNFDH
jgi:hypothetical protein